MVDSDPPGQATPIWYPSKNSAAFALVIIQRHLLVNCLRTSPTAIGRTSGGLSGLFLTRAMRLPPAKNLATPSGAHPEARKFTSSRSEAHIAVGRGTSEAFSRCCIRSPEGPQADALGKDLRTDWMSNLSGTMLFSVATKTG